MNEPIREPLVAVPLSAFNGLEAAVQCAEIKGAYEGGLILIAEAYRTGSTLAELRMAVRNGLMAAGLIAENE